VTGTAPAAARGVVAPGYPVPSRLFAALLVAVLAMLVAGCNRASTTSPASQLAERRVAAQAALDALGSAVKQQDRAAFEERVITDDPEFGPRADWLFSNLTQPGWQTFNWQARALSRELSAARQAVLPGAWAQQVEVEWQLEGDDDTAQHEIWLTFIERDGEASLAGVTDGPVRLPAQPLWFLERVQVARSGSATVLGATSPTVWLSRGRNAAAAVKQRVGAAAAPNWGGAVVLVVPSTPEAFGKVLGASPDTYDQLAAVAWADGPDAASAAVRIIVNPARVASLTTDQLAVLVTHEATHVATHSVSSAAPMWLAEGFADYVAYSTVPSAQAAAEAIVVADVRANGLPTRLPSADRFTPRSADLNLAYAQSWLACRYLVDRTSPAVLGQVYETVDSGRSFDTALRLHAGRTEGQFVDGWGRYLKDLAAEG
jgi:hypothetical protein